MMLESRSTTDGMMPARSGASTVDGRDGHIPMEGIAISMLIIGDMSTALVCHMHGSHNSQTYVSHIRMHLYIESMYSCYKLNTQNNSVELYHAMIITHCYRYFDTSNVCCFNIAIFETQTSSNFKVANNSNS